MDWVVCPRSGAGGLGTAWNTPINLSLPLLALPSMCTAFLTALATTSWSPLKLLVMDRASDSCLFYNSCNMKIYSHTGSLIDCAYSDPKELSALTSPVSLCPREGN